ncbi:4,5-dihydroxyphthalate decarboxylase [Actinacidiphila sp. bgisy144]|uniref:4,5-dihydroxyphthalate decarboxylase n=1 Tax=Actinacidiphila sp. bgisy144 TaxID=3413791 RepID=UPI003EB85471
MSSLKSTFTVYPHTRALAEGRVELPGGPLQFVPTKPIIRAYREMVRELAYDICELAPTTYLMARAAGVPVIAVPVFTKRLFHHGHIRCHATSGIRVPGDLVGRTVGVRAYSVTTGVWVRGLLSDDFGVDPASVRWVTDDEEHVASYVAPPNVSAVAPGESLVDLLDQGRIDAALTGNAGVGRKGAPREGWTDGNAAPQPAAEPPYSLFGTPEPLERDWYRRTGIYPIHGVIVLREELAREYPRLATDLYAAFAAAKRDAGAGRAELVAGLAAGAAIPEDEDPIPYGIEPNARSLEALIRYAGEQHLLDTAVSVEEIFAPGDYPTA